MQFCNECGGALNLFENRDDNICWHCVRKNERQKPPEAVPSPGAVDDLSDAVFSVEKDMLVLTSSEGWILWTGPANQATPLETILKRARRIHEIRMRRHIKN